MSWFSRTRHWVLLALVAVTTVLAVGSVAVGLLAVLAGLAGGAALGTVLGNAAVVLLVAALLVAADLAFAVAFLVTVARRASLPGLPSVENAWLATRFEQLEHALPPLARLGLADRFAVSTETKRERLKQRYVDGELTETEYERRLRDLLAAADDADGSHSTVDEIDADLAVGDRATAAEKRPTENRAAIADDRSSESSAALDTERE